MTVKELIEQLSTYDPEAKVHLAYNYGDYWKTTVAPEVDEVAEENVRWSEYHRMDAVTDAGVDDEPEDGEAAPTEKQRVRTVVVLR